jgi:hypothetical protein
MKAFDMWQFSDLRKIPLAEGDKILSQCSWCSPHSRVQREVLALLVLSRTLEPRS